MSAPPTERAPNRWLRMAGAIALGGLGGALAAWGQLPLAWMIGAMLATTAGAMAGLPIAVPPALRSLFVVVLGVMLGSSFTPAILDRLGEWAVSLSALTVYIALSGAAGLLFFRRLAGYDRVTAYFSAMPGGFSEMVLVGTAMGGDARVISMTHAARVLLIVLALPFAFQWFLDYDPAARSSFGGPLAELTASDLALLGLCGVAGALGARALRVPAAAVVGPMILSAIVHLAGWTSAPPPELLVAAAQVVVGASIGCRFAGVGFAFVLRIVGAAAAVTLVMVIVTLLLAGVLRALTGLPTDALVLAFAPGGLAEMSLIALALSMDAAFVATHHIVRIFLIVVLAPLAFRLTGRRAAESGD
ncbi:MAG: AbrB family transcriptional regulator [Kiloniellales bacterium]|nr:AbrB family transcriptional regulator [Kiloniellales bacterium]